MGKLNMGGGTGTGAAPVIAHAARQAGILTVAVVTKPFAFEGKRRMQAAEQGIKRLRECADTVIVITNQNLFRVADAKTTFADAFAMADRVLYQGVGCITDLIVKEGLINLDFADVRSVMRDMGRGMMGTGEASGQDRAKSAADAAIANPLFDEASVGGAKGVLISISGGSDMTLFEIAEAATRVREEVDADVVVGAIVDGALAGRFNAPARTGNPIEHPRRNLQPAIRSLAGKAAAGDRCLVLVDHLVDKDAPPSPGMPWVKKLALKTGPLGVLSSSCTTKFVLTAPSATSRRYRS